MGVPSNEISAVTISSKMDQKRVIYLAGPTWSGFYTYLYNDFVYRIVYRISYRMSLSHRIFYRMIYHIEFFIE